MAFLLIPTTVFIILSYYIFCSKIQFIFLRDRWISAFVFSFAQIILTEFLLALLGGLYLGWLIFFNLTISLTILSFSFGKQEGFLSPFKRDIEYIKKNLPVILTPENSFLFILVLFASSWIILAGVFLPPRGCDDLAYHLPPIYQTIQKHKFELLPVEFKGHFAFPFYAEFLFMWPAIFTHSQQYVDLVQFFVGLTGLLAVYGLARYMKISRDTSFFLSMLSFLSPVVLMQSGSNYIDLIVAVFFLNSFYLALMFYRYQKLNYLYVCAISLGLMVGMKYMGLALALFLQPFIIPKLYKRKKHLCLYILLILFIGSYWYLRNFFILGNPVYSQGVGNISLGLIHNLHGGIDLGQTLQLFWSKWYKMHIQDVELSRFNGGFGLIFWALSFPLWALLFIRSVFGLTRKKFISFWIWLQIPLSFPIVLSWPLDQIDYTVRYILYIIPIGFLALGLFLEALRRNGLHLCFRLFKMICVIYSIFAVSLMSISIWPKYDLRDAARKFLKTDNQFRYLRNAPWYLGVNYYVWELIEDLSGTQENGLFCYVAEKEVYLAPFYGLKLQNTVYNFEKDPKNPPNICFFNFEAYDPNSELVYFGKRINFEDVVSNPEYALILRTSRKFVFIHRKFLQDDKIVEALNKYYAFYSVENL